MIFRLRVVVDCEQFLRLVTRARKSSEASESKKQETEGKLGRRREKREGLHFRAEKHSAQASAHPLSQAQGGIFCVLTVFVCCWSSE